MAPNEGDDLTLAVRTGISVGELFAGRYEIEQLLGRGGMGSVYRVRDREVAEVVALKLLDANAATPEAIERFRREVRLARRVTHRNAARTYDLGEHHSWRFLTMEYVEGESLRSFINRNRPSSARSLAFALQMAEGLAAAHEAGVIHRDLKPANVLLERGGRVVITDFGIARALQGSDATLQTGGLLGTPAYMAPEQISGDRIEAPADLYALGLILYEMLTGRLPFTGGSPMAVALARLHQPLPDFASDPDIPAPLVPLLERVLARDVAARFQSASEMAAELLAVAASIGADLSGPDGTLGVLTSPSATHSANSVVATRPRTSSSSSSSSPSLGTPTPSTSMTSTPSPSAGRALAVLPFRFRGPESDSYVAETLSDELIDVLSTMRGLRVSGSGATARFADAGDRDPRTIGAQLGVDVIVDGTVQMSDKRVRISARLLDVESGFQLWNERYDGALEDVFELQDKMGRRIAEALRLKLEDIAHRGEAPAEVIEAYLRARQLARTWEWIGPQGALAHYERCLALAPGFKPALAGYAIACIRAWFRPAFDPDEPDWEALSAAAVAAAIAGASELAETQLAAAIHAVQYGRYGEAVDALRQALRIAPTYAAAHDYLGRLQVEAGRPEQGIAHLELALELDPELNFALGDICRHRALRGDLDSLDELMARYVERGGRPSDVAVASVRMRVAAWYRDTDRLAAMYAHLPVQMTATQGLSNSTGLSSGSSANPTVTPNRGDAPNRNIAGHALAVFGESIFTNNFDGLRDRFDLVFAAAKNPRFAALAYQLAAEAAMYNGRDDIAMEYIQSAARGVLVDLEWLEYCPLFAPLRTRPEYEVARSLVRARAEGVWAAPAIGNNR
jgi:serine/threonine protein kinase/tetratricopeptide (TPR) repeat protein